MRALFSVWIVVLKRPRAKTEAGIEKVQLQSIAPNNALGCSPHRLCIPIATDRFSLNPIAFETMDEKKDQAEHVEAVNVEHGDHWKAMRIDGDDEDHDHEPPV